ncbi:MAG: phosphatase PAP2 family protein [Dehalococcoidia bacterium]
MITTRAATTAIALLTIALVAAIALALQAATGALLPFDRAISDELQHVPGGRLYEPIADLLALGVIEYTLLFAAAAYAWRAGGRLLACSVVLVLVARTLNTPLKELIDRPRPGADDMLIREPAGGHGFPSGHSSTVILVYGYAAVVCARHATMQIGAVAVALALAVVALIGWDRVYDGAHWPSDVLGGYATGATLLIIAIAGPAVAMQLWHRRRPAHVGHSQMSGLG